jgi:threonine dehydratase
MSQSDTTEVVSYESVVNAYQRISPILMQTPVHFSTTFNKIVGKQVYFKCENFQKTGSFKVRGALNAVLAKLSRAANVEKYKGCATHSSGNHGQALAWACMHQQVPCTIVLPSDTPQVKIDAVGGYNATVVFCEPNPTARVEACNRVCAEQNLLVVKPYDDYDVMSGQGTIALEFLEQVPHLDAILVSVSGGGLISGISVYAKHIKPSIKIFAVEPTGKELAKCIESNKRNPNDAPPTFLPTQAEGIRTRQTGELTFPILKQHVNDVFTVSDEEMIQATKFVFEKMKLVNELSAGAAVAAAMSSKMSQAYPELKSIGVILCGGNIDINKLPW